MLWEDLKYMNNRKTTKSNKKKRTEIKLDKTSTKHKVRIAETKKERVLPP